MNANSLPAGAGAPGYAGLAEGRAEVKADNRHPAEHANTYKISKISDDDTKHWVDRADIENDDDIEGNKENTANIAENNLKIIHCLNRASLLSQCTYWHWTQTRVQTANLYKIDFNLSMKVV